MYITDYEIQTSSIAGVHSVVVALLSEKAEIQYDPEQTDPEKLVKNVSSLGFGANLIADQDGYQQGKINLIVSYCSQLPNFHYSPDVVIISYYNSYANSLSCQI